MMNANLQVLAQKLNQAIGQMRQALPGVPDDQVFVIARALNGYGGDPVAPVKITRTIHRSKHDMQAVTVGVIELLRTNGACSRGEICRTLVRSGVLQAEGADSLVGRALLDPRVDRVHRGMYRLREEPIKAKPKRKRVKAAPVVKAEKIEKKQRKSKRSRPDLQSSGDSRHKISYVLKQAKALTQPFLGKDLKAALDCNTRDVVVYLKQLKAEGKIQGEQISSNHVQQWTVI